MNQRYLFLVMAAALCVLGTSAKTHAWGAYHAGYTHVGPDGVQHYGTTAAVGPYGAYSGSHVSGFGYGGGFAGAYNANFGSPTGGYHPYTPAYTGGYAVGGYHYGSVESPGVYRAF
jgi:hypothetical protein